jgi:hypothetical protein
MKCANCQSDALWVYESPASDPIPFCDKHLPKFLRPQAKAGLLTRTENYAAVAAEVAEVLAPEEPVEEPKRTRRKAEPTEE